MITKTLRRKKAETENFERKLTKGVLTLFTSQILLGSSLPPEWEMCSLLGRAPSPGSLYPVARVSSFQSWRRLRSEPKLSRLLLKCSSSFAVTRVFLFGRKSLLLLSSCFSAANLCLSFFYGGNFVLMLIDERTICIRIHFLRVLPASGYGLFFFLSY